MTDRKADPVMSIIVVCPDRYTTMHRLTRYLQRQTIAHDLELVFVMPSKAGFDLDEAQMKPFWGYQLVEIGPFKGLNTARARGIQAARAEIVTLTEDHCFPAPGWAAALAKAHEGPWAAVGPHIGLANAHTYVAWANYLIQYMKWIPPRPRGVIDDVPGHNSSYKKRALLEYGDRLEAMLAFEHAMHQDLRRRGYELYLEPDAISHHLFMTNVVPFLQENFNIGRVYAYTLSRTMSRRRRLLRACVTPLMPFVRTKRAVDFANSRGWSTLVPGIIPPLFRGLCFSALGEAVGWWFGPGTSVEQCLELDFHRERFIGVEERHRVLSERLYDFVDDPLTPTLDAR